MSDVNTETAESEARSGEAPNERLVMQQIANIAHCGGLLGFSDLHDAMTEIRRLSMPYWDKEECERLQRQLGA